MFKHIFLILVFIILTAATVPAAEYTGKITWIYDGDTLEVKDIGRVRLLGIDTPESRNSYRDKFYKKRYGLKSKKLRKIARQATKFSIKHSKGLRVRLVTDKNSDKRDKHDRLLAYVYLPDGTMLNRQLLKNGLATVFRSFDFSYKKEFLKLEKTARKKKRGMWQH